MAHEPAEPPHLVSYGTFIKVWAILVALTLGLVGLSMTHVPTLALLGLLIITPAKASLVFLYFMHLKYESAALKYMVAATLGALIIFIALTFADYWYR
jgi:cytochrome c oxidase subunit IV